MNLGAFAVVTLVGRHRRRTCSTDYRALGRTEPLTAFALAFSLACLAGLPPGLLGLFAKVVVFRAPVDQGVGWLAVVMAVNVVIGLVLLPGVGGERCTRRTDRRGAARRRTASPGPTAWRSGSPSVPPSGSRWPPAWCCGSADRPAGTPSLARSFPCQELTARRSTPVRGASVHRHANGVKTAVLLALLSGLILLVGRWLGGPTGLTIAIVIALGTNGFAYFFSDKLALRSMRARPVSEAEQPAMYRIVARALDRRPPADAPALRLPDQRAQRVRHRPQPAQRGGLLHRGHPRPARRARAARRARPRALPRLQPRHPDLLGRRRPGQRDHVPRLPGLPDADRARRRRRRSRSARRAGGAHPRAGRGRR